MDAVCITNYLCANSHMQPHSQCPAGKDPLANSGSVFSTPFRGGGWRRLPWPSAMPNSTAATVVTATLTPTDAIVPLTIEHVNQNQNKLFFLRARTAGINPPGHHWPVELEVLCAGEPTPRNGFRCDDGGAGHGNVPYSASVASRICSRSEQAM